MTDKIFPSSFIWGSATSSYQIEGAKNEDGKGTSIWDDFCLEPNRILNGDDGSTACDHYHRWQSDVDIMAELGLSGYRFSISWPRIIPGTSGSRVNEAGLDFYDRLVDRLLDNNIEPFITLNHWDIPSFIQKLGGWPQRQTVDLFLFYADAVSRRLGDRVKNWITHNEPWVVTTHGHVDGTHAPGIKDWNMALATAHHLLLSHGLAVPVIRGNSKESEIGITLNLCPSVPASGSAADNDAAKIFDGTFNRWYLDPLYSRGYPQDIIDFHISNGHLPGENPDFIHTGDLDSIAVETDFLGINYYSRAIIRSHDLDESENLPVNVKQGEVTDFGWEVYPESLTDLLVRINNEYQPAKIHITENGASYGTPPDRSGRINDLKRIDYLNRHIDSCHEAISAGVPLAGYFLWSLMDNFEWNAGYSQRFGIIWVDFDDLTRTWKDSAYWYQDVISNNGLIK